MGFSFGNSIAAVEDTHVRACLMRLGREMHTSSSTLSTLVQNNVSTSNLVAGAGLTGGGPLNATTSATLAVGAGYGIVVAADTVAVDTTVILAGSGTANKLPKFTGATTLGNSLASDDGASFNITAANVAANEGATLDLFGGAGALPGFLAFTGGDGLTGNANGGGVILTGGASFGSGQGGGAAFTGGAGGSTGLGGDVGFQAGAGGSTSGAGGSASLISGSAQAGNSNGGAITLKLGAGSGSGIGGVLDVQNSLGASLVSVTYAGVATFTASPLMPTVAVGTNNTQGATTAFVQTGFYSADGTAQALSASKTITPVAGARFIFKRAGTAGTDSLMEFQNSSGTPKLRLCLGNLTTYRGWVAYATDGTTERSWVTNAGVLVGFDGTTSNTVAIPASTATLTTWAGAQQYNSAVTIGGVATFGASSAPVFSDIATFNDGAAFTTVAPTSSIGMTFSTVAPTFNNVSPTFATTADNAFQGFEWPVSNPLTAAKVTVGVKGALFTPTLDNIFNIAYNVTQPSGAQTDSTQHSFVKQTEFDFWDSIDHNVEDFYSYVPAAGTAWRPYAFGLNTTSGRATFAWLPNDDNGGHNRYMELLWPNVVFGRDTADGDYTDAATSYFWYGKEFASPGGSTLAALKSEMHFDQSVSYNNDNFAGHTVKLDFDYASRTNGYVFGYYIPTPVPPPGSTTVQGLMGWYAADLRMDLLGADNGYTNVFRIDAQNGSTPKPSRGNFKMAGVGYGYGHIELGTWHLWDSNSGTFRIKSSAPGSDGDGGAFVINPGGLTAFTQTYSTASHTHNALSTYDAALTDSTTGTASTTLVDVTTTALADPTKCNDNFASLARQTADIIADLTNLKQLVNAVIDDGQSDGAFA